MLNGKKISIWIISWNLEYDFKSITDTHTHRNLWRFFSKHQNFRIASRINKSIRSHLLSSHKSLHKSFKFLIIENKFLSYTSKIHQISISHFFPSFDSLFLLILSYLLAENSYLSQKRLIMVRHVKDNIMIPFSENLLSRIHEKANSIMKNILSFNQRASLNVKCFKVGNLISSSSSLPLFFEHA